MFARFRDDSFYMPGPAPALDVDVSSAQPSARILHLDDGRRLSWCETGHRHGYPLIYFHSQAGSRLEAEFLHEAALVAGFRVIAVDRPGIGGSDFRKMRGHSDFSPDVAALLRHLDIDCAGLLGWDGGAAFALAFSYRYPARVKFVTLLAPVAGRPAAQRRLSVRVLSAVVSAFVYARHRLRGARIEQCLARLREELCYADRKQFDNPWIYRLLVRDATEAVRQGGRGVAQDSVLTLTDWDFEPTAINVPVDVWRGGADTLSALCHSRELRETLPNGTLHLVPRQGHFFFTGSAANIFRYARIALKSS